MKDYLKIIIGTVLGTILVWYAGAMLGFFPFMGNDLAVREIGFCTLIICTVIAVCTCIILSAMKKSDTEKHDSSDSDKPGA
ncbi:MAG: hypothetical protein IKY52_01630 [Clostridia bacterium]|nr:hypothetical protein [Clostridia bacterium]